MSHVAAIWLRLSVSAGTLWARVGSMSTKNFFTHFWQLDIISIIGNYVIFGLVH
jgi:hypothetical protein